jgi:hypothetical protein
MSVITGSGSGGSGIEVKTGFDDDDDYARQLAKLEAQIDGKPFEELPITEPVKRPAIDWLGFQALRAGLGLHSPSEAAILQIPIPDETLDTHSLYN